MGGLKSIRLVSLYDSDGTPFEACIGARLDPLLEVDYRYSILKPHDDPERPGTRVVQALSYYNPSITTGSEARGSGLPDRHFHVKVDNPQDITYSSPRPDPPGALNDETLGWPTPSSLPGWDYTPADPLRPEHDESIKGISHLVQIPH